MIHGGLAVLRKSMAAMYFFCSSGLFWLPVLRIQSSICILQVCRTVVLL